MTLFLSSIAPAVIIMFIVFRHDTIKEPKSMLAKAFFGGMLSIPIALSIAIPLGWLTNSFSPGFARSFYDAFFCAGIPEEIGKWIIFYWLIQRAKDFDQYYDGILYAIFISMGFALVENLLYVYGTAVDKGTSAGLGVAAVRAILSVPGHMLFAIPMGYFLSLQKFEEGSLALQHKILSLAIPIVLHGTFDFILMSTGAYSKINPALSGLLVLGFVAFDIWMWRFALGKIKAHITKDKSNLNA